MVVAIAIGRDGINALLVASQVILSIVLPFITFPLLWCTSSKTIMRVRKCPGDGQLAGGGGGGGETSSDPENGPEQWVDYSNGKIAIVIGIAIWLLIVVANAYVIVTLAMGIGSARE
jgi:metal iron transporter